MLSKCKVHPEIQKVSSRARALNESGIGKIRSFRPISRRVSETVQDNTKVRRRPDRRVTPVARLTAESLSRMITTHEMPKQPNLSGR